MDKDSKIKLSIVFLNFNRLLDTQMTVRHLKKLVKTRDDIEVIAVDNASTDGTGDYLKTQSDWLTFVKMENNLGIEGINYGFKLSAGEYILVLDDDSQPYDSNTVDKLIACLDEKPDVGIVACRIESMDGVYVRTWHLPEVDEPGPSMAFVGCGFAIRRDLFEKIGWYPERFFLYQNEIEVAIRVMKLGYKIHYEPQCRVIHRESLNGRSGWRRVYFPTRNTIWIIRRYFPFPESVYLIASRLCMGFIRAIQFAEYKWYVRAVVEAFSEVVEPDVVPSHLRKKLSTLWAQNSIFHQIVFRLFS